MTGVRWLIGMAAIVCYATVTFNYTFRHELEIWYVLAAIILSAIYLSTDKGNLHVSNGPTTPEPIED